MSTPAEIQEYGRWRERSIRRLLHMSEIKGNQRPVCVLIVGESKRWSCLLAKIAADSLPGGAMRLSLDELAFTHPDFQILRECEPGKLAAKILPPAMDLYSELLRLAVDARASAVISGPMLPAERMLQHLGLFKGSGYEMVVLMEHDLSHPPPTDWYWTEASGLNRAANQAETRLIVREIADHSEVWRLDWNGNASMLQVPVESPSGTRGRNTLANSPTSRDAVVQAPRPPNAIAGGDVLMDSGANLTNSFKMAPPEESKVLHETYKRRLAMLEALHSRLKNSGN